MPETWGEHDYYFPGSSMTFGYEVTIKSENPNEEATLSEARIFYATPPAQPDAPADETHALKKLGTGDLVVDMSSYAAPTHSPLLMQFVFEKAFTGGPKDGTQEAPIPVLFGVVLADPEVDTIGGSAECDVLPNIDAKPGEAVSLEILTWGVRMYELPGKETFAGGIKPAPNPELDRFPAGYDTSVHWVIDGTETGTGLTASYTVPDDKLGKLVEVAAWRDEACQKAKATIAVPQVTIVGLDDEDAEVAAPESVSADKPPKPTRFQAKLSPPDLEGTFAWTTSTDKLVLGDGKAPPAEPAPAAAEGAPPAEIPGDIVHVHGTKLSAAEKDQKLKVVWTSKATGKTYEVEHELTVTARFVFSR